MMNGGIEEEWDTYLENLDEKCEKLNYAAGKSIRMEVTAAMSNSFGFGGQNSSVIFKKFE